jgi:hypothetical protein
MWCVLGLLLGVLGCPSCVAWIIYAGIYLLYVGRWAAACVMSLFAGVYPCCCAWCFRGLAVDYLWWLLVTYISVLSSWWSLCRLCCDYICYCCSIFVAFCVGAAVLLPCGVLCLRRLSSDAGIYVQRVSQAVGTAILVVWWSSISPTLNGFVDLPLPVSSRAHESSPLSVMSALQSTCLWLRPLVIAGWLHYVSCPPYWKWLRTWHFIFNRQLELLLYQSMRKCNDKQNFKCEEIFYIFTCTSVWNVRYSDLWFDILFPLSFSGWVGIWPAKHKQVSFTKRNVSFLVLLFNTLLTVPHVGKFNTKKSPRRGFITTLITFQKISWRTCSRLITPSGAITQWAKIYDPGPP